MASFVETHRHAVDEKHFEALYETYKSDVQRLASYLLKNAADAEDAAQTVFLNVLRALRQGVTPADPRAWLLAITRNVCFSRHRAAAARPVLVELDHDEAAGPNGDETPSADEIVGALARLLPNQRTALILRDFRGVSRAEISNLMELSPVAVEALLTRARTAFREELEAGEQPFACAETKKLVEDQLDGLITVADRHSLRSHLRHCADCSTLARAVRSSRGKFAGLIFWPVDLISKLVAAFSEAPTVAHVATALTSTAAVATIAIPAAISTSPQLAHQARIAPWPVAAAASAPTRSPAANPAASAVVRSAQPQALTPTVVRHRVAPKAPAHPRVRTRPVPHHVVHRPATHVAAAPRAPSAPVTTRPSTSSGGGSVHTLGSPSAQHTTPVTTAPSAAPRASSGITTPGHAAPPRSTSPAFKPSTKPKSKPKSKPRSKPSHKSGKHGSKGHHEPQPPGQMPASQPPVTPTAPSGDGAATAGSGIAIGTESTSSPTAPSSSSGSSGSGSGNSGSGNSGQDKNKKDKKDNGNGSGNGKHH